MKPILVADINSSGIGGATTSTNVVFNSFFDYGFECSIDSFDKINVNDFGHIHLPILGTVDERLGFKPFYLDSLLRNFNGSFSLDLRSPFELDIYPFSSDILKKDNLLFATAISKSLAVYFSSIIEKPVFHVDQWIPKVGLKSDRSYNSVSSISRISPNKCIHEFALASSLIEIECVCYGPINDREYYDLFCQVGKIKYFGSFEPSSVYDVIGNSKFVIDLSSYPLTDTDRPQYTILEAMAIGSVPIMKSQWFGRMKPGLNGLEVKNISDIHKLINRYSFDSVFLESVARENFCLHSKLFDGRVSLLEYEKLFTIFGII